MAGFRKCEALFYEFETFFKEKMGEFICRKSIEDTKKDDRDDKGTTTETFSDTDEEKCDQESPKSLKKAICIKELETKERLKLDEKPLPLMLIPYVGSPLAHERRVKRRRLNFNIEESDEEEDLEEIIREKLKKYDAKRLRLKEEE